jgi:hypothetical protein
MSEAIDSNKRKQTTITSTTTTTKARPIAANNLLLEGKSYHNLLIKISATRYDYEFGLKKFMRFLRITNINDLFWIRILR